MSDSSLFSSRFSVSGRTSAKTGRAPRSAKASFAVETKVSGRDDDLVPGLLQVEQEPRHLHRVRLRGRQERPLHPQRLFQQRMTPSA